MPVYICSFFFSWLMQFRATAASEMCLFSYQLCSYLKRNKLCLSMKTIIVSCQKFFLWSSHFNQSHSSQFDFGFLTQLCYNLKTHFLDHFSFLLRSYLHCDDVSKIQIKLSNFETRIYLLSISILQKCITLYCENMLFGSRKGTQEKGLPKIFSLQTKDI